MAKLIVFDADSTLFNEEVIDLLANKVGRESEISAITESAMRGEIDFQESLRRRVAFLAGAPIDILDQVRKEISLTYGADRLLKRIFDLGHIPAVVSGGFTEVIGPVLNALKIKHFKANNLEIEHGTLTGRLLGEIVDRRAKANWLEELAGNLKIDMKETIAIGDGANDIEMLQKSNLGIAFCAKPALKEVAKIQIDTRDLALIESYL